MLTNDLTQNDLTIIQKTIQFVDYVFSFYGEGGVYDMGATHRQICDATKILIERHTTSVAYDSIDRERVRDIMIEQFGLVFPETPATTG